MLITGSVALNTHLALNVWKDCAPAMTFLKKGRIPKDLDAIVTPDEFKTILGGFMAEKKILDILQTAPNCYALKLRGTDIGIHEYTIAYPGSSDALILEHSKVPEGTQDHVSLEVLLLMKMSHRYKRNSPHFAKTMTDIKFLRDELKVEVAPTEELKAILKLREKETYTYKHPSLSQSKGDFFVKDESFYVHDHDDIHLAVKTLVDKPAYQYFQPEGSEVQTSKKMWDKCPLDVQLRAGLEESYVLALERSLVPKPGVLTPKQAFDMALEKVCTSITSGWFREFCWEHYHEIQALYNDDFVSKFEEALSKGLIKPFTRTAFPLPVQ